MDPLDPDSATPTYLQIAQSLHRAIATGEYAPGDKLPSHSALSEFFGVATATVKAGLRELQNDGHVVPRQGSGVFVRQHTRPVGLRPHIEAAFASQDTRIDFAGYTAETLHNAIQEPLDKIRDGQLTPQSVHLRLMLADMAHPIALPSRAGDDPGDDERIRARMQRTIERYAGGIKESVIELGQLGHVEETTVEVRVHSAAPQFKMYLLNERTLFLGFYPVVNREVPINGVSVSAFDPMGRDVELFEHVTDIDNAESLGSRYITEARRWFDSMWTTIARASDL